MNRPFDAVRYAGLLEGLEVTEIRLKDVRKNNEKLRIDSGYFAKPMLAAEQAIRTHANGYNELGRLFSRFIKGIFDINADAYVDVGVPFLRILNLRNGVIDDSDMAMIPETVHRLEAKTELRRGDIVLSKTAYPAASLVTLDRCNTSQDTIATTLSDYGAEHYTAEAVVAYLNSDLGRRLLWRQFQGNVQLHLSLSDGRKVPVPKLPLSVQRAITQAFRQAEKQRTQAHSSISAAEKTFLDALGLENWQPPEPLSYVRRSRDAFAAGRLDAQYFQPKFDATAEHLSHSFKLDTLGLMGQVLKGTTVPYSENGDIPIIRSGDLGDIDSDDKFLRSTSSEPIFYLVPGDVLISSIGFGSIGKVQVFDKPGRYGTVGEVTVVRQRKINPYYLAAFLRSTAGQLQIDRFITGATGQLHLYPRDVAKLWVPILPEAQQAEFEKFELHATQHRIHAADLLDAAKRAVELAIEDSEAAALRHLASFELPASAAP